MTPEGRPAGGRYGSILRLRQLQQQRCEVAIAALLSAIRSSRSELRTCRAELASVEEELSPPLGWARGGPAGDPEPACPSTMLRAGRLRIALAVPQAVLSPVEGRPAGWSQRRERRARWLRERLAGLRQQMGALEQELREAREALTEAGRRTKAVEQLRAQEQERRAQRLRAAEQAEHDLSALLRHVGEG